MVVVVVVHKPHVTSMTGSKTTNDTIPQAMITKNSLINSEPRFVSNNFVIMNLQIF